jgi:hypothetical protein
MKKWEPTPPAWQKNKETQGQGPAAKEVCPWCRRRGKHSTSCERPAWKLDQEKSENK